KSRWMTFLACVWLVVCAGALVSLACVDISYPVITDSSGMGPFNVNTNGKAILRLGTSAMTVGGKTYEAVNFLDHTAAGIHRHSSYEMELATGTSNLHSDTYCNPDWTGCAFFTNDYQAPVPGYPCTFYGPGASMNLNCLNVSIIGFCYSSRPGECGRSL